ncbi:MAG: hypothetical protein AAB546_02295, partial [Patescibacteria group bacterium]
MATYKLVIVVPGAGSEWGYLKLKIYLDKLSAFLIVFESHPGISDLDSTSERVILCFTPKTGQTAKIQKCKK